MGGDAIVVGLARIAGLEPVAVVTIRDRRHPPHGPPYRTVRAAAKRQPGNHETDVLCTTAR